MFLACNPFFNPWLLSYMLSPLVWLLYAISTLVCIFLYQSITVLLSHLIHLTSLTFFSASIHFFHLFSLSSMHSQFDFSSLSHFNLPLLPVLFYGVSSNLKGHRNQRNWTNCISRSVFSEFSHPYVNWKLSLPFFEYHTYFSVAVAMIT